MIGYSRKVYFILSQQVRVLVQMKYLAFVLVLGMKKGQSCREARQEGVWLLNCMHRFSRNLIATWGGMIGAPFGWIESGNEMQWDVCVVIPVPRKYQIMYGWMERPDRDATWINQVALFK